MEVTMIKELIEFTKDARLSDVKTVFENMHSKMSHDTYDECIRAFWKCISRQEPNVCMIVCNEK